MKKLLLLDGNSLLNRAFFALPPLMNKNGIYTNAIYGFCMMLYKIIEDYNPTHMSVAFDLKAQTFRHLEYDGYKAQRKGMPDELRMQLEPIKMILDAMGIDRTEIAGFEADDIIGTLSKLGEENDFEVVIVTGDKDALQLASEKTTILITKKGLSELDKYNTNEVIEKYGLTPLQFIDLKGLMGDQSDNIPGVAGIGEKTGIKLLTEYGSIENIYENISSLKGAVKIKLENSQEIAYLSKKLATIIREIPIEFSEDELKVGKQDSQKLMELFNEFELNRLINKVGKVAESEDSYNRNIVARETKNIFQDKYTVKSIDEFSSTSNKLYIKTVFDSGDIKTKRLIGVYLKSEADYYYCDETEIEKLKNIIVNKDVAINGYKLKEDFHALYPYGITLDNFKYDIEVAEYVLDPSASSYNIESIASKYFQEQTLNLDDILGKGKNKISPLFADKEKLDKYYCDLLTIVEHSKEIVIEEIKSLEMLYLFEEIEMKLESVLCKMEQSGVLIDVSILEDLKKQYMELLYNLEFSIYEFSGEKFNINSPKQLGVILFDNLGLKPGKKNKSGYSTNAEVLESLKNDHPIIELILHYRRISKLLSTYVDGLLNVATPETNRIHTTFNQTITTTGRISSTEPNLQNIPVRTEEGRGLRKVFIAKPGYTLIDADYSQIELRVLAHMANDEKMIESFNQNIDIHVKTASEVFQVPIEMVTKEMRGAAKAVNFGIVYGISDFGLSNNLGISVKDAKMYITNYLKNYPSIKNYLTSIVDSATDIGFSTTFMGRRRYIPELKSSNGIMKKLGSRLAMNTPIQGTAADIIKLAMIKVQEYIEDNNIDANLILQVHDELIIEANCDIAESLSIKIKNIMETCVDMKVKLLVDIESGNSWYDTK